MLYITNKKEDKFTVDSIKITRLRQHTFETKIKVSEKTPQIVLSNSSYKKHCCICSIANTRGNDEISWLGTVSRNKNIFTINDIFLLDQEVSGSETEISTEGIGKLTTELLQKPDGVNLVNSLMYWGHYHTFNSFNPSGQDEKQLDEFKETGYPFFIRGIACKGGNIKFDIYLVETDIVFIDVPWVQENEIERSLLVTLNEEFESKVKKPVYKYNNKDWKGWNNWNNWKNWENKDWNQGRNFNNNNQNAKPGRGTFPKNSKKDDIIQMTDEEFWMSQY
jgi:hypothetical protein